MTTGSTELRGHVGHSVKRLIQRYGVADIDTARRMVHRHDSQIKRGIGKRLICGTRANEGEIHMIYEDGQVFYIVRKPHRKKGHEITVSYLTEEMVFSNVLS